MKYFLDNCICYKYAALLRALDVEIIALRDQFPQNISDVDLLAQLRASGYVFITADRRQATRRQEARAIVDAGLTAVFFGPFWSKMKLWPAAAWMVTKWDAIDSFARNAKVGTCAEFNHSGKFSCSSPDLCDILVMAGRRLQNRWPPNVDPSAPTARIWVVGSNRGADCAFHPLRPSAAGDHADTRANFAASLFLESVHGREAKRGEPFRPCRAGSAKDKFFGSHGTSTRSWTNSGSTWSDYYRPSASRHSAAVESEAP